MKSLPYFKGKKLYKSKFVYLKNVFFNKIIKNQKYGYNNISITKPKLFLEKIKLFRLKNKYFYKFDIEKYYLSIKHEILIKQIEESYKILVKNNLSKLMINFLKKLLKLLYFLF